ncbi:ribonucleotide reductase inhibitor-domain-containing protein [Apiospora arundinis]|uniref:Ribonucleotide reductase inhibitor-domain-containing protein n=1 Tax=Apiospora arundinis TaxID=335852 RepID=A0ABR2HRL7_9PEZI
MSVPRTKRQFAGASSDPSQRQITSFFNSSGVVSSTPPALSTGVTSTPRSFTAASSTDQANLLSVGMRVRKAVPEGYKTGTYSAFALWDEAGNEMAGAGAGDTGRSRANAVSTPRELLPFCGINKVGGLSSQPSAETFSFNATTPIYQTTIRSADVMDGGDELPGLTMSQDSTNSNDSASSGVTGSRTRKRFFVEDEDEVPEMPGRLKIVGWHDDDAVSPRSIAPAGWGNGRVMAVPRKGRSRGKLAGMSGRAAAMGQENAMAMDNDFDEASFLDHTWEVEMSDI